MTEIMRVEGLTGFRELVSELGGDADSLLRDAGIEPAQVLDPDGYIPVSKSVRLLERAAARLKCPDFGMRLSLAGNPGLLGPLSIAMQHADSGRDGFIAAQRYLHFHNTALRLRIQPEGVDGELITLDVALKRPQPVVQTVERVVAGANHMMRVFVGAAYRPREVRFCHPAFAPPDAYRRVFGVSPVFGAPDNGFVVAREQLDRPLSGANPQLRSLALHFLESATPNTDGDLGPKARLLVGRMMRSGECTQADLAAALGLHERTLQRRLKEEETSFEAIKDDVRREIAYSYLAKKSVPLSHVAEVLGYAETSAFTRACRRWFGQAPRELRKTLVAAG